MAGVTKVMSRFQADIPETHFLCDKEIIICTVYYNYLCTHEEI